MTRTFNLQTQVVLKPFALPAGRPVVKAEVDKVNRKDMRRIREDARRMLAGRPEVGVFAWFVRPKPKASGVSVTLFDYDRCVTVAALMTRGFDGRTAAALVNLDYAIAISPRGMNISDEMQARGLNFAGGFRVRNGEPFGLLVTDDLASLRPEEIQDREGYFVRAITNGKLVSSDPQKRVNKLLLDCPEVQFHFQDVDGAALESGTVH